MTEIKKGYKKTEIGIIPEGWGVVNFKNFFSSVGAKKYQVQKSNYLKNGDYPIIDQGQKFIVGYSNEKEKVYKNIDGVIIFGDHTRIIKFIDFNFVVGADGTQLLKSIDGINQKFSYYVLSNKELTNLGYSRHFKLVKEMKFPLPPLKEQEEIADILSTADEKIDAIALQIQKAETLKKGLLQKLLSEGIGHSEFKDSELGKIPENWEVVALGNIGSFKNGINKNKEDFGFGNNFFNLLDVFGLTSIKNNPNGLVNITDKEKVDFDTQKGDTFFIRSSVKPSGVGLTAVLLFNPIDTVYSGFIIRFRDNNRFELNFKKYCFYDTEFRKRLLSKSSVSANTNINQEALKSLLIKLPPLEEQKQIADILSTADEKLEVLRAKKEKYETLKKGLLQKLLSGEVRV